VNFIAIARGGRESERAGFERRQAEADLQEERQEEGQGADADAEERPSGHAREEGRNPQKLQVEDGVLVEARVADVEGQEDEAHEDLPRDF
jgi:hypothetical protein